MSTTPQQCREAIDAVASHASRQIAKQRRQNAVRSGITIAVLTLAIGPLLTVLAQLIRWRAGLDAGRWFSWPVLCLASCIPPIVWLLLQARKSSSRVDRLAALGTMDAILGSSERIMTADQFLKSESPDAFMQAAIQDSTGWVTRGQSTQLELTPRSINVRGALCAIPLVALLTSLGVWIASLALPAGTNPDQRTAEQFSAVKNTPSAVDDAHATAEIEPKPQATQRPQRTLKSGQRQSSQAAAAQLTPDAVEDSQGKLTDGETRESQRTSSPSRAHGQPSTQAQASKSDIPTARKPNTGKQRPPQPDRPQRPRAEQEQPSGATAGQGSSGGAHNNAAASDWSSRSQQATPDDEDVADEDDVDDEEEEQQSRGGVQPNMRDRRTPVNRDLMIGFGNARPNPDANGRGGPGGQKKSRGVASLVLGVPIPDRITGQPNKGRIRITQQRVTPEAEDSDRTLAEPRMPRTDPVGAIHHPKLAPWLQNLIRRYFLTRRQSAESKSETPLAPSTNSSTHPAKGTNPPS